ncbi:MAG: T9SS type A sorting domain-containing protein [Flavisolibacter sp.]
MRTTCQNIFATLVVLLALVIPKITIAQVPANDNCAGAILLTSGATCSNTAGTQNNATLSGGIPGNACAGTIRYDVWYKFVAQTISPTITLSNIGANFLAPHIQLLSGSCAALTNVACNNTTLTASGLTVGQTYYIRVYSTSTPLPTTNAGFNICITESPSTIDYSKSYINITKGTNGGTIDPGDTLEMRATFVIKSNAADSLSFVDTLYNGNGLAYVPGSMILRTNEGTVYKTFTDVITDANDPGYIQSVGAGPDTVIHMNFGLGATRAVRGKLRSNSRPSVFTTTCIIMATYRVVVYAGYNSKIGFKTGVLSYRDSMTNVISNITWPQDSFIVYKSPGLCPNATAVNNAIGGESNGTFGTASGAAPVIRNRGVSAFTNYTYWPFGSGGGPQDYYYAIANNTAATWTAASYASLQKLPKPDASNVRIFSQWDITGDHTGAATAKGNPPCDTTKAQNNATNPCGYMLIVNSAYRADTAFQYTVTNLCQNTNYEISAWFKNICYKCACDSAGTGASSAGYIPPSPGSKDSSGVMPNLAFDVDGTDYYTTGNLKYIGIGAPQNTTDTTNRWQKRGFTYTTGTGQTSFTLTIRNNAPGGGGNDWALDDINVVTCLPNMLYSPSTTPMVCQGNTITINDTIVSYFNNYVDYKWQKSTDGGTTFNDIVGTQGTGSPAVSGSNYSYVATYTIPPTQTQAADSGTKYRVLVATNVTNLGNVNCQVTDGTSIVTLKVINCGSLLSTQLLSFNGKLINDHSNLYWSSIHEAQQVFYEVEKSFDGTNFKSIRIIKGINNSSTNYYSLIDSVPVTGDVWYRITLTGKDGDKKYSNVIELSNHTESFNVTNVVNPFNTNILFNVHLLEDTRVDATLLTLSGTSLRKQSYTGYSGVNSFSINNLDNLPPGVYVLQVKYKDLTIIKKVIKR